jgi:peptide/nickel transport system substrate-binding protein
MREATGGFVRTPRPRWPRAVLGLVVLAALAAGCSGHDAPPDDAAPGTVGGSTSTSEASHSGAVTTTTRTPVRGGTLSVGVLTTPAGLDPIVAAGDSAGGGDEMLAIYDTLLRYDPATGIYEPRLAQSLVANDDRTVWTITLRAGIAFSDGTPFDADAVKFGLDRHRAGQPGAPACETLRACPRNTQASAASMAFVRDITVTGPLTLTVSLTVAWTDFAWLLSTEPGMIPSPTALRSQCPADPTARPSDCSFNRAPVGAGPFVITSFTPGEGTVVSRNVRYWDGAPFLDGVRFSASREAGSQKSLDALTSGSLDVAYLRDQRTIADAISKRLPGWSIVLDGGATELMNTASVTSATHFLRVRQAIAAAIDPAVVAERVTGARTSASADLFGSNRDLSPGLPGHVYDPERARRLTAEAKANGWNGKVRYLCDNSTSGQAHAIAIETMLKAADIEPVIDTTKDAAAVDGMVNGTSDFDLACGALGFVADAATGKSDGTTLAALTRRLVSTSTENSTGWKDSRVDAAVLALRAARTESERREATRVIVSEMVSDAPFVVTGALQEYVAYTTKVRGVLATTGSRVLLDDAWLATPPNG